jgi:DNA (cytosine-5)-methyltransferase 1
MDIGVAQTGFRIVACVELDPYCCETLRAAAERERRDTRIVEEDIRKVQPTELMEDLNLKPGDLDLLFGGPPCQAFSQIGKQNALRDERGLLLFQMARFAEVFHPKAVLIEQVKGVLSAKDVQGRRGEVFQMLLADLERIDYVPKWQVILAADFGVPQLRERVFIVATKKPNGFKFPTPTHGPAKHIHGLFPLKPFRTVGEALKGLRKPSKKTSIPRDDSHVDVTPAGDKARIHGVPEGSFLAAQTHLPREQIQNLTKKDTTKFLRVSRGKPANTLRCGEIFFHPTQDRYLTPREYMRIHGYPDEYLLKGPIRGRSGQVKNLDQHRQVANSVPPPIAKILAEEIERILICRESSSCSATT